MTSAVAWLGALRRLQRAFNRSPKGARIPILTRVAPPPTRSGQRPELHLVENERQVEIALRVENAASESTRIYWDEEAHTLAIYATARRSETGSALAGPPARPADEWFAEVPLASDVDGARAEAFLKGDTLRIIAPRVDCHPLTGLPLLVWPAESSNGSFAVAT
ncbi:MAG TPA: hypothetical protein VER11_20080 [Polyangiaceae bacterium]|nr:hypothetical protein [Polyangiaceae bacterium]